MKKIMILGAGIYQVPLIKKAKEMGLYTIVVSIPGNYPGFHYADKICYEDTTDVDKIIEIAKGEDIDGIVTTGTDVAVITIGKVCDALGLPGVSEKAARVACDKNLMKEAFRENIVNTADFRYVKTDRDEAYCESICEDLSYPVIFKAIDSSGSRGITKVTNASDIDRALNNVRAVTKSDLFLIERYLEGSEFGAQAFVQNGKIEFVLPHGDYVFQGDTGVPVGHYVPYDVSGLDEEIFEQTTRAIKAMGLDNCAINADFMLSDGKVYVLEIGARAGATQLVELVSLYYGYNYYQKIIEVAMGQKVSFDPCNEKRQANASHLVCSDKTGIIKNIDINVPDDPNICEIQMDYKVGDEVRKFKVGPDRIGHVITVGETLNDAQKLLFRTIDGVSVVVK